MKQIWAPWRMQFIEGEKEGGCIFCTRMERSQDQEDLILYRGASCSVFLNKYPYSNGHLMVVPHQHTAELGALDAKTSAEIVQVLARGAEVLETVLKAQGFNMGMNMGEAAGAGIKDHIHFHLVPRWVGDTNYMPVLSDTKVMPQALEETYDILKKAWDEKS